MKDYKNVQFGSLIGLEVDKNRVTVRSRNGKKTNIFRYWLFKCDCGNIVSRIPAALRGNKFNRCDECSKGSNSHAWKGFGEISHEYFRSIYHSAVARKLEFNITIEYLWGLFLIQERKCKMTGFDLKMTNPDKTASLDRIDSSKGYIEGNLQWIHSDVNYLKKNFTDERFVEICKQVAKHCK